MKMPSLYILKRKKVFYTNKNLIIHRFHFNLLFYVIEILNILSRVDMGN